jgi:hypothetical protein
MERCPIEQDHGWRAHNGGNQNEAVVVLQAEARHRILAASLLAVMGIIVGARFPPTRQPSLP